METATRIEAPTFGGAEWHEAFHQSASDRWVLEHALGEPADDAESLLRLYKDKGRFIEDGLNESLVTLVPEMSGLRRDPDSSPILRQTFGIEASQSRSVRWHGLVASRPAILTFDHCWALELWSKHHRLLADGVTIVHLDAHDDLSSPSVSVTSDRGRFRLPTNGYMEISDPESVAQAVARGFVGIGSFIVPFVHAVERCEIFHLVSGAEAKRATRSFSLGITTETRSTFLGMQERPALTLGVDDDGPYRYTISSDHGAVSDLSPSGPVLLDIDLDYFCNAYDDGPTDSRRGIPSIEEVLSEVEAIEPLISRLASRVQCVTIAMSPGFFPTAYLPSVLPKLESVLIRGPTL